MTLRSVRAILESALDDPDLTLETARQAIEAAIADLQDAVDWPDNEDK